MLSGHLGYMRRSLGADQGLVILGFMGKVIFGQHDWLARSLGGGQGTLATLGSQGALGQVCCVLRSAATQGTLRP